MNRLPITRPLLVLLWCVLALDIALAQGLVVGSEFGSPPPRLVVDPENTQQLRWQHIESFGPVPPADMKQGQQVCRKMNHGDTYYLVVGYHPQAQDLNGQPFAQGAYLCMPE